MATSTIQINDISQVLECWYGYESTENGFIKLKKPTKKLGRNYKPVGVLSATNGIICLIGYEDPSDSSQFYVKCMNWNMQSSPADGTTVGCYVIFAVYLHENINL